jgi:hypothetical protein
MANIGVGTGSSLSVTGAITSASVLAKGSISAGVARSQDGILRLFNATNSQAQITLYTDSTARTGFIDATGNITGGNLRTTGRISATGNITSTGLISTQASLNGATLSITTAATIGGTLTVGTLVANTFSLSNVTTTGIVSATGNITGGNITTAGRISAVGNVVAENIGTRSATGNISGGNVVAVNNITATTVSVTGSVIAPIATISGNAVVGGIKTNNYYYANGTPVTFGGASSYGNSNVAAYLPTYTGALNPSTVTASATVSGGNLVTAGNAVVGGIKTNNYYYANGTPVTFGSSSYGNANVAAYLPTYTGSLIPSGIVSPGTIQGGNLTTGGTINAVGNVTANRFNGSGAGLTGIPAANISGTVATATTAAYVTNLTSGNITTALGFTPYNSTNPNGYQTASGVVATVSSAAQPNITSVGTLNSLTVTNGIVSGSVTATGTVSGGNLVTAGSVQATGSMTAGNVLTAGSISATGNITGGNIITSGSIQFASVSASGNITGGNLNSTGAISAVGAITTTNNVSAGNLSTGGALNATTATIRGASPVVSAVNRTVTVSNVAPTSGQGSVGDIWYQTV